MLAESDFIGSENLMNGTPNEMLFFKSPIDRHRIPLILRGRRREEGMRDDLGKHDKSDHVFRVVHSQLIKMPDKKRRDVSIKY